MLLNGVALAQTALRLTPDHDDRSRQVLQMRERQASGRSYVTYDGGQGLPADDTGIYVVPAGSYFMMGDNRDNSLDSRFGPDVGVGMLPAENIVGKAEIVAISWKPGAGVIKPWTWLDFQWDRFLRPIR
ncbi:hypothetical protein BH10PSE2_BH10PSE2_14560 [soil metagenome]